MVLCIALGTSLSLSRSLFFVLLPTINPPILPSLYFRDEDASASGDQPLLQDNQRRVQLMVVDNELEYNESMIVQREEEIREIEYGITELNEIFRDLGTMVNEQGTMLGKSGKMFFEEESSVFFCVCRQKQLLIAKRFFSPL